MKTGDLSKQEEPQEGPAGETKDQVEKDKPADEKTVELKESEYQKILAEAAEHKDKYLRLLAEFENARKRMDRDKQEFVKYANEGLILDFLAILDDLERTLKAVKEGHEDKAAFQKGVEMVMAHIYEMLKNNNVKPIDGQGKPFDPNTQEILMQEETKDFEDGIVIEEFQKGYKYGDRVIRTAKVKVAKRNK